MSVESKKLCEFAHVKLENFISEYKNCKKELTEEHVHDIRVALRRLMALTEIMYPLLEVSKRRSKNNIKLMKQKFKTFGPLRDIHTSILYIDDMKNDFPDLESFLKHLNILEEDLSKKLSKEFNKMEISDLKEISESLQKKMSKISKTDDIYKMLLASARTSFEDVISLLEKADSDDIKSIHKVRIAFKKFRYMIEVIDSINPVGRDFHDNMKAVQDILGNIQDLSVVEGLLCDFIEKEHPAECGILSIEYHELLKRQKALVESFLKSKEKLCSLNPRNIQH